MRLITGGVAAAALVLLLSGCVASAPTPTETPIAAPTPVETAPAGALTCDDLASSDLVAAALTGVDGATPELVEAWWPRAGLGEMAVTAAGGLDCSWRAGAAVNPDEYGATDGRYLRVEVLPGGGPLWQPYLMGDGPAQDTDHRDVGGAPGLATCGDPGCRVSVPVGDTWIQVNLTPDGWNADQSVFAGMDARAVLDGVVAVAASAVEAVDAAGPTGLGTASPTEQVDCESVLPAAEIETIDGTLAEWSTTGATLPEQVWFDDAARHLAGFVGCRGPGAAPTLEIGPGAAALVAELAARADGAALLAPVPLAGMVSGDVAVTDCTDGAKYCTLVFSHDGAGYSIGAAADATVRYAELVLAG
ncbi:hypothetical protein [Agromyces cerinus]|uniref:Uncharacterized protein n=1 Tax=Agromyces cerinus subsp. cerinus TaxID=232089 RepID=A0A1N6EXC6_9MICO|nr:hypothetical protein [Agromyces cerinus]SIN87660.1 hypothetical protein SAMN05443544_1546 [Agromyces cerinus subsp. cerinus]